MGDNGLKIFRKLEQVYKNQVNVMLSISFNKAPLSKQKDISF